MTELTEGNDMSTDHGAAGFCTNHTQPPDERVETVARVLRAHWPYFDGCRCQWRPTGDVSQTAIDHRKHLAAAVVAALDDLPRTALRRVWEERQEAHAALDRVRALRDNTYMHGSSTGWHSQVHTVVKLDDLRAALDPEEPR